MDVWSDSELDPVVGRRISLDLESSHVSPVEWAQQNQERIANTLHERGALLLRSLKLNGPADFARFLRAVFADGLEEYLYRSTPRTSLGGNVYTATEYPPSETIPLHNESSYASIWPMRIAFFCMLAPNPYEGGATPLADSREVLRRIPAEVVERFRSRDLQYVRNYGLIDLPWSEVFQTDDRKEVETFCEKHAIDFEWIGDDGLRTKQVTPATAIHPVTGDEVWFNQAHLFHVTGLGEETARDMLKVFREDELPRNVYFGDGSPIESGDLASIRKAYAESMFHFKWRKGDVILLDNMLFSHGRQPFSGERKILTGMSGSNAHVLA